LDEPLSNLDAQLRDDTRAELKQLHQSIGITTVYVTHDQVEAMTLADKIVVLSGGRIQQIGEPQGIYADPVNRMVATFLGNPPMNIIPTKYTAAGFDVNGQLLTIPENINQKLHLSPGQNIDLGIRPEDIQINHDTIAEVLQVEVKLVEPLGRETLIRVAILGTEIILNVQTSGNIRFHVGDKLNLELDLQKLFLFDSASGDKLYP
jgi:multiple sugar transport system ATP-binding protein